MISRILTMNLDHIDCSRSSFWGLTLGPSGRVRQFRELPLASSWLGLLIVLAQRILPPRPSKGGNTTRHLERVLRQCVDPTDPNILTSSSQVRHLPPASIADVPAGTPLPFPCSPSSVSVQGASELTISCYGPTIIWKYQALFSFV